MRSVHPPSSSQPLDRERWKALCHRFRCAACDDHFLVLEAAYSQRHRHYHTATHMLECLDLLDRVGDTAVRRDEVELAIWLHDVVYVPWRDDNEERSAEVADRWLRACDDAEAVGERVRGLILATRHVEPPASHDEALLQDVDLGVLGAAPERYDEYEAQIRREYGRVPSAVFRSRRAKILRSFLERRSVYSTAWFLEHREAAARSNLQRALERLHGSRRV